MYISPKRISNTFTRATATEQSQSLLVSILFLTITVVWDWWALFLKASNFSLEVFHHFLPQE